MSIQVQVTVMVGVMCDGISNTATVDLERDPINVAGPLGVVPVNFFSNSKGANPPSDAVVAGGYPYSVALVGRKVTVTWASAPVAGVESVAFYLLF